MSQTAGVAIEFSFPLGRYHATAAGTAVNEAEIEWPPSPWRILRAFVSVWKRRAPELPDPIVIGALDQLAAPCLYTLPDAVRAHTRHYLVGEKKKGEQTPFLTLDPFMSCRRRAQIVASWPGAVLDDGQRHALDLIADRLTYLGRAESLCDARLLRPGEEMSAPNAVPVDEAEDAPSDPIRLLVPDRPLNFEHLCVRLEAMRTDAKRRSVLPPSASWVSYRRPSPPLPTVTSRRKSPSVQVPTVVRFQIAGVDRGRRPVRPPLRDAVLYTSVLRAACQSRFRRISGDPPSPVLSGRSGAALLQGHSHAHYLALPARAGSGSAPLNLRIESLAVWAPSGLPEEELAAVLSVRMLRGYEWISEFRPAHLVVEGYGKPSLVLDEIIGPSRSYRSLTPFFPGHHPHQGDWTSHVEMEVRAALRERRFPEADATVHIEPAPRGFRTHRPKIGSGRTGNNRALNHPYHVRVDFGGPVTGPVCLGALSHFGLGLFLPLRDSAAD